MIFWRNTRPRFKQISSLRELRKWCDAPSCPKCGYDLRGCRDRVGGPCPECGQDCRWSVLPGLVSSQSVRSLPVLVDIHMVIMAIVLLPIVAFVLVMLVENVGQSLGYRLRFSRLEHALLIYSIAPVVGLGVALLCAIDVWICLRWVLGLAVLLLHAVLLLCVGLMAAWAGPALFVIGLEVAWQIGWAEHRPGHPMALLQTPITDQRLYFRLATALLVGPMLIAAWVWLVIRPCRRHCARLARQWMNQSDLSHEVGGFDMRAPVEK